MKLGGRKGGAQRIVHAVPGVDVHRERRSESIFRVEGQDCDRESIAAHCNRGAEAFQLRLAPQTGALGRPRGAIALPHLNVPSPASALIGVVPSGAAFVLVRPRRKNVAVGAYCHGLAQEVVLLGRCGEAGALLREAAVDFVVLEWWWGRRRRRRRRGRRQRRRRRRRRRRRWRRGWRWWRRQRLRRWRRRRRRRRHALREKRQPVGALHGAVPTALEAQCAARARRRDDPRANVEAVDVTIRIRTLKPSSAIKIVVQVRHTVARFLPRARVVDAHRVVLGDAMERVRARAHAAGRGVRFLRHYYRSFGVDNRAT